MGAFVRAVLSAASALCVRLMIATQVYGGSLSLVIGAYLSVYSGQDTFSSFVGGTVVSGLRTELNNIRISGSRAGTHTIEGVLQLPNHTFRLRKRLVK